MHASHIRHQHLVFSGKIIGFMLLLLPARYCQAQYNIYGSDRKYESHNFHFGISLGLNFSNYKVTLDSQYVTQGEVLEAHPVTHPGFGLGILSSWHLSKSFELRFIPDLAFSDRSIEYKLSTTDTIPTKNIESVYLDFPVNLKYRSRPYRDFRMYVLAGFKYSIDMQSNAKARLAENLVKVNRHDFSLDYGVGCEFHLPLVTISPELRVSYGLTNVLKVDDNLIFSRVLEGLRARSLFLTVHFEG